MKDYQIRVADQKDMDFFIELAYEEGWNPGLSDGKVFYLTDPKGFLIGELAGEKIGCISAVRYQEFGFLGLYIVKPAYRGRGYGMALWQEALQLLARYPIGLDGVVERQGDYKKAGFVLAHRNMRFASTMTYPALQNPHVVPVAELGFPSLAAYDRLHFPAPRAAFLEAWFQMPRAYSFAYVKDQEVQGLGTLRKCSQGFKIGPLFARTLTIAHALFSHLASLAKNETVYLDIPAHSADAHRLVEEHSMQFVFETARMYTKGEPAINHRAIYGITTFELG